MPHIPLPEGVPGPRGPMLFRPETAKPMSEMAEILMRGPSTLTLAERELIGTYVTAQNDCRYCQTIHGAVAAHYLGATEEQEKLVQGIKCDPSSAPISAKLKALLTIAGHVQLGGKYVTADDIAQARQHGATDLEIHDTVLIAANFCMMNRYVDGLATWAPEDPDFYRQRAANLALHGYVGSLPEPRTLRHVTPSAERSPRITLSNSLFRSCSTSAKCWLTHPIGPVVIRRQF